MSKPTITVVCADRSHEKRAVVVLARDDDGVWRPDDDANRRLKGVGKSLPQVVGGDVLQNVGGPERLRYRFACTACGDDLPMRAEKLQPVLDKWAAAGESEISLEGARRVGC